MKKSVYSRKNDFNATGIIVKNDAFINGAGTVAHFRMAVSSAKDKPSVFFDCVTFGKSDKPLPVDLLKKGSKIEVKGYFHMNEAPAREGQEARRPELELVVNELTENQLVEIEVPDDSAPVAEESDGLGLEDMPESL